MTLDEFRNKLNGEFCTVIASSSASGNRLSIVTRIKDGESSPTHFIVKSDGKDIYYGYNFSSATRRYWELVYGGKP